MLANLVCNSILLYDSCSAFEFIAPSMCHAMSESVVNIFTCIYTIIYMYMYTGFGNGSNCGII